MSGGELESDGESVDPAEKRRFVWTSVAVFTALTAILFWRYALSPATTVSDHGDPFFLIWTMEWVERALIHSPGELFNAPIFRPFADTLAYSDPVIPQSVVALPLRLVGFGPITSYNLVFLGGIAAAGVITALLFFELTNDRVAALFGAAVATFPTLRLAHLAHVQLQVTTFLPLALLLVHRVMDRPTLGRTLALAASLVAAPLASLYYGLFLAIALPPFTLTLWLTRPHKSWPALGQLLLAATVAACMLAPVGRVYRRAIGHIGSGRNVPSFSDLLDYFSVSHFADISEALHLHPASGSGPEWVGGGGALLIPVALLAIAVLVVRKHGHLDLLPQWARKAAPYSVLGCVTVALTLGPDVNLGGRFLVRNPLGFLTTLPGTREIRDFGRPGFLVAIAGGALIAIGLSELSRRRLRSWTTAALCFVGLSTIAPTFSSSLPWYRPPPLRAVYAWLEAQPDPAVIFEVPLPKRGNLESLDYLLAAARHKKALIHGISGYHPATDVTLRNEATGIHRPDFFRALAHLGATHLVVHTAELSALPNGAASLASLRESRGDDLIARFPDGEVYRVRSERAAATYEPRGTPQEPLFAGGGWSDPNRNCLEIGEPARPLVFYVPQSDVLRGIHFVAETALGQMDDALVVERSVDLGSWDVVPHGPLLSTSLAAYVAKPTHYLWSDAVFSPGQGSFLRISSRQRRLRFCGLSVKTGGTRSIESVSGDALGIATGLREDLAKLAVDGKRRTRWQSGAPQSGHEWIDIDLGKNRDVVAVVLDLGEAPYDYGRELAVACGSTPDAMDSDRPLRGQDLVFERPRPVQVVPLSAPRSCRFLRVRQTGTAAENYWSVAEVTVLERDGASPAPVSGGPRP